MRWIIHTRFLLLALILGVLPSVQAQKYVQTIQGKVMDKDSKVSLPGATVQLLKTNPTIATVTGANGNFRLEQVPVARYDIQVTYLGYEPLVLPQVQLNAGKELVLTIELTESVNQLNVVDITSTQDKEKPMNEMTTVSARTFSVEETQRYSASFGDPSRMALSFAGVSTSNDASNEIIIRGNSSRGLLWRLEGLEIPNPNHFANTDGSSGGAISMLSSQTLATSDFLTGAFSAEYGNALSGVFDLRLRKGNYTKREYAFQLSGLGVNVSMEGPFSKKWEGSYLFNYRYSTIKLLDLMGLKLAGDQAPDYQDLSFNFNFPAGKAGVFTFFGLGGINRAGADPVQQSSQKLYGPGRYGDHFINFMGTTGITHTYLFSNHKTYLKTVWAFSAEGNHYQEDSLDNQYQKQLVYKRDFDYYNARATTYVNHKFSNKHILRSGIIYTHIFYSIFSRGIGATPGLYVNFVDETGNSYMLQGYADWKYRINPKLELVSGLHAMFFGFNNRWSLEPRSGLRWKINTLHTLTFGVGLHSRIDPLSNYTALIQVDSVTTSQANRNLNFSRAVHVVGGYDWVFLENMHLKAEAYFQYIFDVAVSTDSGSVFSMINQAGGFANTVMANDGLGRNYGLEITVEKFFSKNYFFLFTGSLYNSEYSMGDGAWRNTRFNGNYALNILGGYEFHFGRQKQNIIGINTRIIWRGGNRYIPINLAESIAQGREVTYDDQAYEQRLPDFFRWDMSALLKFNFRKWSFSMIVDVQNVINRQNVGFYTYNPYTQQIKTSYMFGIIPMVNFKFEF